MTALPKEKPRFTEPMKARLQGDLPRGDGWQFEVKLDGIRAIAVKDGDRVQLFSRLPRELTREYPQIVDALRRLPARQAVVDGEICALDAKGRTSFQLLQNRRRQPVREVPILYFVFDLLHLDGRDWKRLRLAERQAALEKLLKKSSPPLKWSAPLQASAERVWKEITKHSLEGMIAKRKDSAYEPGRRSGAWLKIKTHRAQEFVIGGYTPPEGTRKYFGSIVVGYYSGHELLFASRVGTGFDFAALKSLFNLFQKYRTPECPFVNLPTRRDGKWGQGITASDMSRCVWLKPKLVCQVRFMEWTGDDNLRQPVFVGLRDDKKTEQVKRED